MDQSCKSKSITQVSKSEIKRCRQTIFASYFAFINGQYTSYGNFAFYSPTVDQSTCRQSAGNFTDIEYNITLGSVNDTRFESIVTEMDLICDREWIVPFVWSLFSIGNGLGSLAGGPVSDRFGRRRILAITNVVIIGFGFCAAYSPTWQYFAVCWVIVWTASSLSYLTGSVYAIELLGDDNREWAMSVSAVFAIGAMLSSLTSWFLPNWKHFTLSINIQSMFYMPILYFLPESRPWLEARQRTLTPNKLIQEEQQQKKPSDLRTLFSSWLLIRITVSGGIVYTACSLCYFGLTFNAAALPGSLYTNNAINALVELGGYIAMALVMTRANRKVLVNATLLIAAGSCATCAVLFSPLVINPTLVELGRYISFVGRFFISACFGCIYVYVPELFPTTIRSSGTGLCILLGQVGSFLAPYTKLLPHVWMIYVTFTVTTLLGVCCVGSLHETRNIPIISTISELQALYAKD